MITSAFVVYVKEVIADTIGVAPRIARKVLSSGQQGSGITDNDESLEVSGVTARVRYTMEVVPDCSNGLSS